MSTTIEERIVSMKFQGEQFLVGIDNSLKKLDQFNNKLKAMEGTKSLDKISASADRQVGSLSKIAEGVQHISDRFKAMGVVGMAALSNITNQAIFAGQNMIKSLTMDPILQGFREYELNMNSIQTILANTQAAGTKLSDVTAILDELNHYSDQTIYNFAEMARNIGTFTAAGVALKPAAAAIKGIANLAALSGSNSEQASAAMYQLSQAISAGRVTLEDWNSVVNAGMGGTVFQRALALNAEKLGTLSKGAVKLAGDMKNVTIEGKSFRESITAKPGQESWLTSKVLTQTLAQFTGDLSDAQLAAQGFSKSQIKAIQDQARTAKAAATEVKTMTQLMGTLRESAGSGWSQTWKTIFGDFPEAKKLFTNVNNVLGGFVSASADARNKVLADWAKMGGRTSAINAIGNAFNALITLMKPIKEAFREIFPAVTAKQLTDLSKTIENFTKNLMISGTTANNIKRTFAGFFAILDIGWQIVKQFVSTIFSLLGLATEGSGGFLNFTASVGDFIVGLDKAIKSGDGLKRIFNGIEKVLSAPIKLIKQLAGYLGSLFDGFNGNEAARNVTEFTEKLDPLGKLGSFIAIVWGHASVVFGNIWKSVQKLGDMFQQVFGPLGDQIANALTGMDYKDFLNTLNTGLFGAIVILIKNFIEHIKGGGNGFLDTFKEGLENLTGALGAMQNALRAATLLQIAVAIGILAVSMNVLSKIDAEGLTRASAAITVMFAQLVGSLIAFEKISGFAGFAKMPFVAGAMILMATAVTILASAVSQLSELSWEELGKGLSGVTVILGALVGTMQLMPDPKGMISTGLGLLVLSAAIKVLASAVADLSSLSWEELGKGLTGVAGILAALTLFTKFADANKGGLLQGAGLLLLATGIKILASAVGEMAGLSWGEIAKGLVTMAGSMAIMVAALMLVPPTAPLAAAGVLGVAVSLGMVADALVKMGGMSWGEIGKSLTAMLGALTLIAAALYVIPPTAPLGAAGVLIVAMSLGMIGSALQKFSEFSWAEIGKAMTVLAGSLGIIAIAMMAMQTALPGAAALLVVSAALAIFTPVLMLLGAMSWGEILTGLGALALAFTVIGVAGALLTPVVPTLLGFGAAIALLGAGLALVGAGVFLFATGLTLLAASGVAAASALVAMVTILIGALPQIVQLVGALLVALLDLVIQAAPKLGEAVTVLITVIIKVIGDLTPKIVNMIFKLLVALVNALASYVPKMVDAGLRLLTGILNGIANNVGKVITAATNVIVAFLNGIGKNLPRVLDAGVKMIISFVNGLANSIRANTAAMQNAGLNLAMAIIDGMTGGLASGVGRIVSKAKEVASSALDAAKSVLGIHSPSKEFEKVGKYVIEGFRKGLDGNKSQIDSAFRSMQSQLLSLSKSAKATASERAKAASAYRTLTNSLADENTALGRLANQYDVYTGKINEANEALAAATKTRDDYNASLRDQFSDMATPAADASVGDYLSNLEKQVEDTQEFANTLQMLRKLGLNDETYKDLIAGGLGELPFAKELLAGGQETIDQLNALDKQLDDAGTSFGKSASSDLYQAAVDAAAGLVEGLKNQQAAIEAQMDEIANYMVRAIKNRLGIKSPSRVFAEIGKYSAQGLTLGLEKNSDMVADSASSIGDKAVEAVRISLSNVDKMVSGNIDVQPTIRPVLDLTDVRKNAGKIGSILPSGNKMRVDGAYSIASSTSSSVRDRHNDDDPENGSGGGTTLNYTQNNYSPKPLSSVEIYRGTKNQLSTVKGALST